MFQVRGDYTMPATSWLRQAPIERARFLQHLVQGRALLWENFGSFPLRLLSQTDELTPAGNQAVRLRYVPMARAVHADINRSGVGAARPGGNPHSVLHDMVEVERGVTAT